MKEKILHLKTLISNVDVKIATATEASHDKRNQIVCVVTSKDQIILRYVTETAEVILKKVDWFQENDKVIQDAAFDPSSTWLLVLCLDNTLHIVPALGICDKSISFKCIFTPNEITSFIVPFIGPHDCPNSQKCPNHIETSLDNFKRKRNVNHRTSREVDCRKDNFSTSKVNELITSNAIYNTLYCDQKPNSNSVSASSSFHKDPTCDIIDKPISSASSTPCESHPLSCSSTAMEASTASSESTISSCPFPTAVIWWKTHLDENRAILGYSDGCIVVVCKFIVSQFIPLINICCFIFSAGQQLSIHRQHHNREELHRQVCDLS